MGFFGQEYWSGLSCPPLWHLPYPGIEPASFMSPALAGKFFTTNAIWEPLIWNQVYLNPEPLFLTTVLPALQNTCQWVENSINFPTPHNKIEVPTQMAFLSNKIKLKSRETKLLECPSLTILTHCWLADYMWSLKGIFICGKLFLNMILQDSCMAIFQGAGPLRSGWLRQESRNEGKWVFDYCFWA